MSTRGWTELRRRRTFLVTRSLATISGTLLYAKKTVFREIRPLMETFLECETMFRKPPPGHVFLDSLAEIDLRKVVEVMRRSSHKKQRLCDPFFRALSETHRAISLETCKA